MGLVSLGGGVKRRLGKGSTPKPWPVYVPGLTKL